VSKETYPARVPHFSSEVPTEEGYYWWKAAISEDPEIVKLEISGGQICIECIGDDRPILNGGEWNDDTGLFSDKIPSIWKVEEPVTRPEYKDSIMR